MNPPENRFSILRSSHGKSSSRHSDAVDRPQWRRDDARTRNLQPREIGLFESIFPWSGGREVPVIPAYQMQSPRSRIAHVHQPARPEFALDVRSSTDGHSTSVDCADRRKTASPLPLPIRGTRRGAVRQPQRRHRCLNRANVTPSQTARCRSDIRISHVLHIGIVSHSRNGSPSSASTCNANPMPRHHVVPSVATSARSARESLLVHTPATARRVRVESNIAILLFFSYHGGETS